MADDSSLNGALADRFTEAFQQNTWQDGESVSGPGSTLRYTSELRATLPAMIRALGCASMLDAPCGDFNWMKAVDLAGIAYTGADIVPEMVKGLQETHPQHSFVCLDLTKDPLPTADFVMIRDVLFHLSNADVVRVLQNFVQSGSAWLATSHSFDVTEMVDVVSGPTTFRPVNLTTAPFHFAQPDHVLKDYAPGFLPRWMGIWPRAAIAARFGL
ncbi:MAG: class I SAM-dependent methyltransferase [Phenylobacterium sp.]|nr:MAG: class I SAM-dependent methyltransferase [Phenylobacterium sp.]